MVVNRNIDVPLYYNLCQLCHNITQLLLIAESMYLEMSKMWLILSITLISYTYLYKLMSNVKLPVTNVFDSHIRMHYSTQNNDVSLAKEF